jgi:diguanylate cyclase (GGDEF)-like protein
LHRINLQDSAASLISDVAHLSLKPKSTVSSRDKTDPLCFIVLCVILLTMEDMPPIYARPGERGPKPFKAPHLFLRRLAYIAAGSAVSIILFTGFGVWTVVSHYVIRYAENSSVNISAALLSSERESFFTETSEGKHKVVEEIPPGRFGWLDERIRQFLKPFGLLKVKVYARDARIIYSTDHTIIGERDPDNRRLRNALGGRNDSELVRKDRVQDLADEQRLDVDVVETYVPIYGDHGEVIGCLEVYMDVSHYRDEIRQIVSLAMIVIGVIMLAVYGTSFKFLRKSTQKLKEAQDMLEQYAATDPLTGLHNRRHILARARQELARFHRERAHDGGHPGMSFTMLDLDHFKKINDTYGHLVGDEVLKETARRILATTRAYDLAGRFGGEEFIVVHPNADYAQAQGIASRIWGAIRTEPYVIEGRKINVTASLGVATLDPATENDFMPALKRADLALYDAKNTGRDRVA